MALVTLPDVTTAPQSATPHRPHLDRLLEKHVLKAPSVSQLPIRAMPVPCKPQCKPQRPG